MSDSSFKSLEAKVDTLIQFCSEMKSENQYLRKKEHEWQTERTNLLNKNQLAKSRLEKVLDRLKTLQQE